MFSLKLKFVAAFALAISFTTAAFAQDGSNQQPALQDNYVTHTSFKNRVFEVKYRDPDSLVSVIKLLTSGHKGAQASADRNFKTITVRDFPENIASIEEALKRLDTPEAPRPEIELRMHVLIASNTDAGMNQYPPDLKDAVGQLQSTLNYKNYYLLTSIIQRAKERAGVNPGFISGEGLSQVNWPGTTKPVNYKYRFQANSLTLSPTSTGATTVQLNGFNFSLEGDEGGATIRSDVGVREGEKVIVGTAGLRDKGLILVLTAKLIK
ncbi:MAG TPA: secretin N-terminal domain-containing protein [Pyrinomonadaceae bacterium]|nr:secretin N-terminal domain-containing protein [Pyrinomonadaceae bacterium]